MKKTATLMGICGFILSLGLCAGCGGEQEDTFQRTDRTKRDAVELDEKQSTQAMTLTE